MMMMMMAMIMTMMMILRMFMTTLFLLDGVIVFLPIQPLLAEHLAVVYLCRDIYTHSGAPLCVIFISCRCIFIPCSSIEYAATRYENISTKSP